VSDSFLAGLIFLVAYAAIVFFKRLKTQILWLGIAAGILTGLISARNVMADINWNVLGIFTGTLVLAEFFILSRVPAALSTILVKRSRTVGGAFLGVCLLSSALSIFIENIAVVLIVAPITFSLCRKIKASPVPAIIGIAIASNLQGTATLIGDPPSMILANYQRMNFNNFFFYHGRPSIFFAVEIGAIGATLFLYYYFRRYRGTAEFEGRERIRSLLPAACLSLMILALALATLVDPAFRWFGGVACLSCAGLCFVSARFISRLEKRELLKRFDWSTTLFLAGVFVMVGMLGRAGLIENFAHFLARRLGSSPLMAFGVVVGGSVMFSAFVDNVPYLTAMIPVVQTMSAGLGIGPELLVFGLLIGACLGGNITPVGASANIVATGLLHKDGYTISFWEFVKIGLPFTLIGTLLGSGFIYLVWG
jgi:Na+/H+ antiporter NhaD/arsenite permease-like protein